MTAAAWRGDKRELQRALEHCTDYAFQTGDTSIYGKPSYKALKVQLVEVLKREKQS
jgi:hypothetical protein